MQQTLKRRTFLKQSAASVSASVFPVLFSRCRKQTTQPNILWIISEDTSPDLGCYGNALVQTPGLDQLASEGMRFTRAFATCPVCSPVRSGLMTGMYQTSIGAHQHRTREKNPLPEPVKVITEYFKEAGYFTANMTRPAEGVRGTGKTDWNFIPATEPFDGTDWTERAEGQPFFAQVNMQMTHRHFKRDAQNPVNPDHVKVPPQYPDHSISRRDWADYLESLQVLDGQVGKILNRLKTEGLDENTIVFYFGDHGSPHVWAKQWLYEGGIRIPLIIKWPGKIKPGTVNENLVSTIDLGPTAMNMADITIPGHIQGQPFLGRKTEPREYIVAARDRCDETVDRIRCVRTENVKYIRNYYPEKPYLQFNAYKKDKYPVVSLLEFLHARNELTPAQARFMSLSRPEEELYDLETDPFELENLAEHSDWQDEKNKLAGILDRWIEETGDMGAVKESDDEIQYWQKFMNERFTEWSEAKGLKPDASPKDHLKYWKKKLFK